MATRNFVPRGDNEGSLGTSSKRWSDIRAALGTIGTLIVNSLTPAAGTNATAPIVYTSGTNLTTPAAGAQEYDGKVKYFTPVANNRAVDMGTHFQVLSAGRGFSPTANTPLAVFNASTNGALTVAASTSYLIDAVYVLTNTSTTSHTWAVLFGGTATLTSGQIVVSAVSTTSTAMAAVSQGYTTTLGTAYVVTAASTSATESVTIRIKGIVRINASGTFIPQIQSSATLTGTQTILANSYISLIPVGSDTVTNVGNWS